MPCGEISIGWDWLVRIWEVEIDKNTTIVNWYDNSQRWWYFLISGNRTTQRSFLLRIWRWRLIFVAFFCQVWATLKLNVRSEVTITVSLLLITWFKISKRIMFFCWFFFGFSPCIFRLFFNCSFRPLTYVLFLSSLQP